MVDKNLTTGSALRVWAAIFAVIALVILAGGYWYYREEAEEIHQEKYQAISAIGKLKSGQIQQWRKDRLSDITVVAKRPFLTKAIGKFSRDAASPGLQSELRESLNTVVMVYEYSNALLLDPDGNILVAVKDNPDPVDAATRRAIASAIASREAVFSDFFRSPDGIVYIDVAAVVRDTEGQPLAVAVLRSNAEIYLYPLIQSWPTPSRSAETLLVQREGEEIVFLNELRHKAETALSLREPLTRTDLPAVQAVLGKQGKFEGRDYRDVEVLADLLPIPGSPWFMVAKVDAGEIFAEARYRASVIVVIVGSFILLAAAATAYVYRQRQAGFFRDLYESERRQREIQETFRITLYSIGDAVITTDTGGGVRAMNLVAETLTGWTEAEARGKSLEESFRIVNEETRAMVENPVHRVLRDGKVVGLANHTLLIARDGTERPIADSAAPIRDEKGSVIGVVLVFRDQTEERTAQRAVVESEERLRLALASANEGLYDLNVQTGECVVSPEYARMLGYDPKEFRETNAAWRERLHPDDREDVYRAYQECVDGRRDEYRVEYRQLTQSGGWKWILSIGRLASRSADGRPLRMIGTQTDITERKLGELALKESEERYRILAEVSMESMLLRNSEEKIVFANPAAFLLLHASKAEDLLGQNYLSLVHPDDWDESARRAQRSWLEKRPVPRREHRLIALDGQVIHVESTGVPVEYKAQQFVLGIFHDITERKLAEEEHKKVETQLRQAQKMEAVGRLAGGVAHDFNNMLGVILGFTDLAITKLPADDPIQMYLDEVKSAAQRSADITRQLLAFARKQTIAPKVLDLNDTIASMLKMLRRLIGEDIDLLWKPAKDLWPVKMDPAQIDQVLANLMVNARDAIAGVGKITIETDKVEFDEHYCEAHVGFVPGRYVLLAVSDDGCGMDKETLAKLFEPFFTTKEVGKGTGLGLATIYGIVKQNNGFINVYSEPGQGTAFKIYLPRQEPLEAATEQPRQPAEVPTGTETVLLVEDEKSLLKFARMLLEELGYTVLAAGSPREAIQLARECTTEIHLLVTDVVMPEMSGRDLWGQLKVPQPGLKCLFMSGYTANVIAHHGVLDEDLHFLQKPFSRGALATKIREALS